MKYVLLLPVIMVLLVLVGTAAAHEEVDIVITNVWARPTTGEPPAMAGHGAHSSDATPMHSGSAFPSAAYMTIENRGAHPVALVSASTSIAAMVQIHETTVVDNVARMGEVEDGIIIPAGESAELRPGSFHIMLMDLMRDLSPGEAIALTLTFELRETDAEPMEMVVGAVVQDTPPELTDLVVTQAMIFDSANPEPPHAVEEALAGIELPEGMLAFITVENRGESDAPFAGALHMDETAPLYALIDGELFEVDEYDMGSGESAQFVVAFGALDMMGIDTGAMPFTLTLSDDRVLPVAGVLADGLHEDHP
ncbi:MAG: copper chaperone PCu(A)C [Chloroflexota bacterium]|nr:copper chaperone PCu(A)C [Chloroflexota bacterium]